MRLEGRNRQEVGLVGRPQLLDSFLGWTLKLDFEEFDFGHLVGVGGMGKEARDKDNTKLVAWTTGWMAKY